MPSLIFAGGAYNIRVGLSSLLFSSEDKVLRLSWIQATKAVRLFPLNGVCSKLKICPLR